jgi:group I intron endonuclease
MNNYSEYKNVAGVYKLTCGVTNKIYVGKSINLKNRFISHKYCENKKQGKCYLQHVIKKYGWNSFTIEILEIYENFDKFKDNTDLLELESHYISLLDSTNNDIGYNICKYSRDRTGYYHSEESKEKMRKPKSEETREKIRLSRIGKHHSKESNEKNRKSNLGRKVSDETKEKMRNVRLGYKTSEETKEKLRQLKVGIPLSEETKEKMRESRKNSTYTHSEETRKRIGEASRLRNSGSKRPRKNKEL